MYKQKYSIRIVLTAHRLFFFFRFWFDCWGKDLLSLTYFMVYDHFLLKLIILVKPYGKNYKSSLLFNSTCPSIVNISAWLSAKVSNNPDFRHIWLENCHKRCRQNTWTNYISCKRKINKSAFVINASFYNKTIFNI